MTDRNEHGGPSEGRQPGLSEADRAILDFELSWSASKGSRAEEVWIRFGISLPTYYQRRAKVVQQPAAATTSTVTNRRTTERARREVQMGKGRASDFMD